MNATSPAPSGFERLHPAIQYHIVNSLRWPALRPLQHEAIEPLLAGEHALLLAPTAGGKTEAAMLPVLSRMLAEEWRGLSVLYVCPIRALLNNLEPRLAQLAGMVGRTVGIWHGDVGQGARSGLERELPDILLTTPESIEGMLIGSRRDHRRLLGAVRVVIVDELHAFAADDRGWHLLALLERIRALGAPPAQRIGLSATVGKPAALLEWLAGPAGGATRLVAIPAPPAEVDLTVDYAGSIANAALLLSRLHTGEKRLVFCDSRSKVEELALELRARGTEVFVSHAALSAELRLRAEQAFAEGSNCIIVATSTLELGLDVGDLDRVIQIDAPSSVASFLQRLGRTGRREGTRRNLLFITTTDEGLLEALAIAGLFRHGYVEPVRAPVDPWHLIAQQLIASIIERRGEIEEAAFLAMLGCVPGFAQMLDNGWRGLRDHLLTTGYLLRSGAFLSLGPRAEQRFRGKGLAELCVSFDSPRTFAALHGTRLVGHLDPLGLSLQDDGPRFIALGGQSWRVMSVDAGRARVQVTPTREKGKSRWQGSARGASRVLSRRVRSLIAEDPGEFGCTLSRRARTQLDALRQELEGALATSPVSEGDGRYTWWTWNGLAHNRLLAARIAAAGGRAGSVTSWSVSFQIPDEALDHAGGWRGIQRHAALWTPPTQPKFAELLPEGLVQQMTYKRAVEAAAGDRHQNGLHET